MTHRTSAVKAHVMLTLKAADDDFEIQSKRQVTRALTGRRPVPSEADDDFK